MLRKRVFRAVLRFAVAPSGLLLAAWQLKRHYWKQNLLSNLKQALENDPKEITSINEAEYNLRYKLKNVALGKCLQAGPKGMKFDGKVQFSNAFICSCDSPNLDSFLMHFGWLPIKSNTNSLLKQMTNISELMVIREADEQSGFIIKNEPEKGIWRVKDIAQLSQALNTQPVMFRALEPVVSGLSIQKLDLDKIPNRHMEYVFTWCGLSLTALAFSFLL